MFCWVGLGLWSGIAQQQRQASTHNLGLACLSLDQGWHAQAGQRHASRQGRRWGDLGLPHQLEVRTRERQFCASEGTTKLLMNPTARNAAAASFNRRRRICRPRSLDSGSTQKLPGCTGSSIHAQQLPKSITLLRLPNVPAFMRQLFLNSSPEQRNSPRGMNCSVARDTTFRSAVTACDPPPLPPNQNCAEASQKFVHNDPVAFS